jgi:hypothetical protein
VKTEESNASSKLVQRPRFVQRSRIQNHGRNAIWAKVLAQGIARYRKESQPRVRRTLLNQLRPLWDVHLLILSVHLKILRYDPTQIHHLLVGEMDTRPSPPRCAHPVQKCSRGLDVRKRALLASLPCRVLRAHSDGGWRVHILHRISYQRLIVEDKKINYGTHHFHSCCNNASGSRTGRGLGSRTEEKTEENQLSVMAVVNDTHV